MPATSRLWGIEGRKWVESKRREGKYAGVNGETIARLLRKVGEYLESRGLDVTPRQATEETLYALLPIMGKSPKSKRVYYTYIGAFCASQGNSMAREKGFLKRFLVRFPVVDTTQPRLTAAERNEMFQKSVGQERVVLALMSLGLRRIEVVRMRLGDIEMGRIGIRGKGYLDEVSRYAPINRTVQSELDWYVPMRAQWAGKAEKDTGHLLCWMNGTTLQGYSWQSIDRLVHAAGERIGKHVTGHMLRRTTAEILRDSGATIWEIAGTLGHKSVGTTQVYLERLDKAGKLVKAGNLLEIPLGT